MPDTTELNGVNSDPAVLGWMTGAPVPKDRLINPDHADHMRFPQTRWAFSNMRKFLPTARISRGQGAPSALAMDLRDDLDALPIAPLGSGTPQRLDTSLVDSFTDAFLVMHKGAVVFERYFGVTQPASTHIAFSVTKSFIGTIAEILIEEGKLAPARTVAHYLPELAASGFGDATVRDVLDMRTALNWSEIYDDSQSDIIRFSAAVRMSPRRPDYSGPNDMYAYLPGVLRDQHSNHGEMYNYRTVNTEVIGWIIARIEGKSGDQVISERIWQPLGMEQDGDIICDPALVPFAGGGMNLCLRDMARFGEMMRAGGMFDGRRVVPQPVVDRIRAGSGHPGMHRDDYPHLPGFDYSSQWWHMNDDHGCFSARGIHGQAIWINPAAEMVIARFGSMPDAANTANDPLSLATYRAIADHLMA
ncbi:serine hydrolase [Altererythrobacter aquiaggeris]|uniref:serine hydrolase domain-containing protein n=1 Tax=Aestuarierythrobacter aquiaggeris TaxID=1898396 RepID=UPI003015FFBB